MACRSPSPPPANSPRRCVPNLPGSLTRSLSKRLGVDATTAMRIALLYGDMEWLAAGASQVRYSARDYARRQGLSRNTVLADLHRLQRLGSLSLLVESSVALTLYGLNGLHPDGQDDAFAAGNDATDLPSAPEHGLAHSMSHPGSGVVPPPGLDREPPPAQPLSHPWLTTSATLEKGFKTQEKRREEGSNQQPHPPPPSERVTGKQEPKACAPVPASRPAASTTASQLSGQQPSSPPRPSSLHNPAAEQKPSNPEPATADATASKTSAEPAALLDRLLAVFHAAKPAEWPSPKALTLSPGRRGKLQAALRYAGSADALLQRLQTALAHVPPWYRSTYPVRPDGSRRPSHQFFDLLFRATGDEREGGLEAWHLFAWSEAGARASETSWGADGTGGTAQGHPTQETDLQKAKRLFYWDSTHWCAIGIPALELPMAEKRRLTTLLEEEGIGRPGTAATQYADALPDGSYAQHRHLPSWITGVDEPAPGPSAPIGHLTSPTGEQP